MRAADAAVDAPRALVSLAFNLICYRPVRAAVKHRANPAAPRGSPLTAGAHAKMVSSMRIGWFFPTAFLLAAAMIWMGVSPGLAGRRELAIELEDIRAHGYVVEGAGLADLVDASAVTHEVIESGALTRARMTNLRPAPGGLKSNAGVLASVPAAVAHMFEETPLRVTITARRAPEDGSTEFAVAYFIEHVGFSGWRAFTPTARFADYSFEWTPPANDRNRASMVGITPDASGGLGALEVLRIRVELADPEPADPDPR